MSHLYPTKSTRTALKTNPTPYFNSWCFKSVGCSVFYEIYNTTGVKVRTDYYVRDASGSVMAVYEHDTRPTVRALPVLKEHPIYGASRLGVYYRQDKSTAYQLTDHLGNVRAVVAKQGNNAAALVAKTDYYPFGMPMPNRNIEGNYRYGYQGEFAEKEKELGNGINSFELRLWDSRIGRWLTTDPKGEFFSPYLGMGNNPIRIIDPDGGKGTDWYKDKKTGDIVWFEGSGAREGYEHLGFFYNFTDINNNNTFYDGITKGVYQNGEALEYHGGMLDEVVVTADIRSTGEKASGFARNIANGFVRTSTKLTNIIGSQGNVVIKEGLHEGRAYNSDNYLWPHYWELNENWGFEKVLLNKSSDLETVLDAITVTPIPAHVVSGFGTNAVGKLLTKKATDGVIKGVTKETIKAVHNQVKN